MEQRVRVKICGVTRPDDLSVIVDAGADAVGFNFHPPSPRSITIDEAKSLLPRVPLFVQSFGVFVLKTVQDLQPLISRLPQLTVIQVHGGQPETHKIEGIHYVPAFQVRESSDLAGITTYLQHCREVGWQPSAILVDGYAPGLTGGTGQKAPWNLLENFKPGVPLILAGGLTPDNVADAITSVRPFAIDVATGVESRPGCKDPGKVRAFIENARRAAASL